VGLGIISLLQINDFLSFEPQATGIVVLSPLELISFIGSIILFLILTTFLLTKKYETDITKNQNHYFTPKYEFYRPTIFPTVEPEVIVQKPTQSYEKKPTFDEQEIKKTFPAEQKKSPEIVESKSEPKVFQQTVTEKVTQQKTTEHIKEFPSNGKAVIAKFIKREEPKSEIDKIKEELDKIKFQRDKLVSIISHDLRTPLNSVFGYCQLLKDGQYKNKNEVKQFAENIFELSKQQLNALNKIIEWTKYESSSLALNPTEFDVTSTINFVAKSMSKIAEAKNIKIIVNSKPNLYVYGDEFMIIEVLKNLLDNAIKFSYPDSSIEIHTHYHEKINKLVVLVVDSGVGIDREILMNLLVSTKKITTRGTKGEKGLGLGLLIVKAIIDKHGEHLWIASEEGKWTRVYFTLKPSKISESG
jgi:signal transduction histidine kinase